MLRGVIHRQWECLDVGPHSVGQSSGGQLMLGEATGHRQMFLLHMPLRRAAPTGKPSKGYLEPQEELVSDVWQVVFKEANVPHQESSVLERLGLPSKEPPIWKLFTGNLGFGI